MQQLSLFDKTFALAGVLPGVKAAMRRIVGEDGECRKSFVDKLNAVALEEQIPLTGGNVKVLSLDMLNKILSPSDTSHPPSIYFTLAFCKAAKNYDPLRVITRAAGFDLMNEEERLVCELHKADKEEKAAKRKKQKLVKLLEERL